MKKIKIMCSACVLLSSALFSNMVFADDNDTTSQEIQILQQIQEKQQEQNQLFTNLNNLINNQDQNQDQDQSYGQSVKQEFLKINYEQEMSDLEKLNRQIQKNIAEQKKNMDLYRQQYDSLKNRA